MLRYGVYSIALDMQARLAQSHETLNLRVVGSSPTLGALLLSLLTFGHWAVFLTRWTVFVKAYTIKSVLSVHYGSKYCCSLTLKEKNKYKVSAMHL